MVRGADWRGAAADRVWGYGPGRGPLAGPTRHSRGAGCCRLQSTQEHQVQARVQHHAKTHANKVSHSGTAVTSPQQAVRVRLWVQGHQQPVGPQFQVAMAVRWSCKAMCWPVQHTRSCVDGPRPAMNMVSSLGGARMGGGPGGGKSLPQRQGITRTQTHSHTHGQLRDEGPTVHLWNALCSTLAPCMAALCH